MYDWRPPDMEQENIRLDGLDRGLALICAEFGVDAVVRSLTAQSAPRAYRLTMAQRIARRKALTRPRVTQAMSLLGLPK